YLDSLVVTDGLSKGIVKLAGKAVRDYNDAYGQDRISLLAVLPWKWVPSRSELVSKDFHGAYQTSHRQPCQDLCLALIQPQLLPDGRRQRRDRHR
uniref:LSDAT_euk domain-containing protein n=1 Tax=Macrostomum lignano TaxID=282301 RepID=A0A1I8FH48_9PLAT